MSSKHKFVIGQNPYELQHQLNTLFETGWKLCEGQVGSIHTRTVHEAANRRADYFTPWACVYLRKDEETELAVKAGAGLSESLPQ
jgi:hypothetical protein